MLRSRSNPRVKKSVRTHFVVLGIMACLLGSEVVLLSGALTSHNASIVDALVVAACAVAAVGLTLSGIIVVRSLPAQSQNSPDRMP